MANVTIATETRDWLLWFLKLRVIVYTVILGILVGVERIATPRVPFGAVMGVLLVALSLTLIYSLWVNYASNYLFQALCHIVTDLVIITLIIYYTGGTESYFSILYFLPIAFSSLVLYQQGALLTAFSASMVHASLLLLTQAGFLPTHALTHPSLRTLIAFITLNTFAFLVVGYFSGYLSENLRRKGAELVNKTGALASLKALNENIIQSLRGGLLTTDLDGKVTMLNPAGEEIVGRRLVEVLGGSIKETFPDVDFERCIHQLRDGRRNVRVDSILRNRPGEEKFLGLSASPLYGDQHVLIGYLVNFQDLTEMKRLEGEIRAKDRMAAVGEMAAGMAHEIRNPLASISGSVGLLRKEVPLTDEQDKLMSIVLHESQRLNKIIDGFLIYSRQITYNPRTVDLNELMEDTVTLLYNNPEVTAQHRIESISDQHPLECHLDPDLIKQVFWNLSHNAIRAMPEGGTLTIELKKAGDDEVRIVFRDTGVGIEEERIDRIFEPFHSSFANGTGLGLAIVYQIVQAHHGRIEAHSSEGLGSVFEISLPCQVPVQVH
ncbi:MAG: PAS domain-containing protein [Acidobacteriia bacterium]|nr:PAS domain-containing protein [Terriglobia bacterium]